MKSTRTFSIVIMVLLIWYWLFPNNNVTSDGYGYAADIRYNLELFRPHHLLYSPVLYLVITPFRHLFHLDVLRATQYINGLFSVLNLIILYRILLLLNIERAKALSYTMICAFSFSVWYFSGQNESYIMSSTFSLLGSYYSLKGSKQHKYFILSGLLSAFACLLHQVMVFWWIGLAAGVIIYHRKPFKNVLYYLLPAIIVPAAYVVVLHFQMKEVISTDNLLYYVFNYYYKNSGILNTPGWKARLLFCTVALIRVWIQLYGSILVLLKESVLFWLPVVVSLAGVILIAKWLFTDRPKRIRLSKPLRPSIRIHLLILIMQALFAFYSDGNFEFLVMMPYLVAICLGASFQIPVKVPWALCIMLFVWNFLYGILPGNIYDYTGDKKVVAFVRKNPDSYYLTRYNEIDNIHAYETGMFTNPKILDAYTTKTATIDSLLNNHQVVYTDMINEPKHMSRGSIIGAMISEDDLLHYSHTMIESILGFYGTRYIYKITQ